MNLDDSQAGITGAVVSYPDASARHSLRRHLFWLSVGVSLGLALLGMGMMCYGRGLPESTVLAEAGLEECAGLPCFRGLQPEHTAWVDAVASIEGRWSIRNDGHFGQISLFVARDNLRLESIFLETPRDPAFTLGTIMNHYGKPDCVQVYRMSDVASLHYRHLQVLALMQRDHFRPTSPVMSIVLGDFGPQDEHEYCTMSQREAFEQVSVMMDWRGFAPKQAYMQVPIPE